MMEWKKSKHVSPEKLPFSCVLQMDLILGEPIIPVRVGYEFQAEIPPLIAECNCLQPIDKLVGPEVVYNELDLPWMELPIPIMWTHKYIHNHVCVDEIHFDSQAVEELDNKRSQIDTERFPLPGTSSKDWMPDECERILLGLYIFGKNFILIEKFLQTVKMGDILSFYHGKFYQSDKYGRWSKCWKSKSRTKRIICGRRMFTGWRHQELLSRLFLHVSADCQKILLETAWMFEQGEYSFQDYIFTLSTIVGIDKVVGAVGIGTGKQDLTGTALKPSEGNKTFSYHPGNPMGKAFSSLSSAEILELLTGGFRLSKSQCSDLFWDAVWPRLQARGWHSKNQNLLGSKKSSVFLLPGIKNFSRRVLVKGNHYFDSINDILHKVALDPKILDQELEKAAKSCENLQEHDMEPKLGLQDEVAFSRKKCGHYLQPRNVQNSMQNVISAVVDASLIHQEQPKMTESLPREVNSECNCFSDGGESSKDTSEDVKDKMHTTDVPKSYDDAESSDSMAYPLRNGESKLDSNNGLTEHKSEGTGGKCSVDDDQPSLAGEDSLSGEVRSPRHLNCLDAVKESLDLNACVSEELSSGSLILSDERKLHNHESNWRSSSFNGCEDMVCEYTVSQLGPFKNLSSPSSQAISNPDRCSGVTITDKSPGVNSYVERSKPVMLFDLNLPYVPSDVEAEELFSKDPVQNDGEKHVTESPFTFVNGKQPEPWNIIDETCQGEDLYAVREKLPMFYDLNLHLASEKETEKPTRKDDVQNNVEQHKVDAFHGSDSEKVMVQYNDEQHVLGTVFSSKSMKRSREQFRKDVLQNNGEQHVVDTFPLSKSRKQSEEIFWEDVVQENDKQNVVETILPSSSTESMLVDNSDGGSNTEQLSAMNSKRLSMRIRPLSLRALEALEYSIYSPRKKRKYIGKSENKSKKYRWQTKGSKGGTSSLNDGSVKPKNTEHSQMEGKV